jgi:peptide/nickel transport system permease protein
VTLGLILTGPFIRLTRVNMIETLQTDFITAGRARGLPENRLVYRHALRNTFIPILTLIGLQFALLLAGAVLTETTFSWPGMGRYLVKRIELRDYNAVQSVIALFAMFVGGISVLVDILYAFVDPRIRY